MFMFLNVPLLDPPRSKWIWVSHGNAKRILLGVGLSFSHPASRTASVGAWEPLLSLFKALAVPGLRFAPLVLGQNAQCPPLAPSVHYCQSEQAVLFCMHQRSDLIQYSFIYWFGASLELLASTEHRSCCGSRHNVPVLFLCIQMLLYSNS